MDHKLDFHNALDSISWDSLLRVLEHRGFPPCFCTWIVDILHSVKITLLLNGTPGSLISCKNAFDRAPDPLSPYVFIIMVDILHQQVT
jgi:hypothetical protein